MTVDEAVSELRYIGNYFHDENLSDYPKVMERVRNYLSSDEEHGAKVRQAFVFAFQGKIPRSVLLDVVCIWYNHYVSDHESAVEVLKAIYRGIFPSDDPLP